MTPKTDADREAAREWVEQAWKGPKIASCEDAFLAGAKYGKALDRPTWTWTGAPPTEAGKEENGTAK